MRDEEAQSSSSSLKKDGYYLEGVFGKGKYKMWALGAIILLAIWSLFTGSVTLKWSAIDGVKSFSNDLDSSFHADLDVLDVDERLKMVHQMWNIYKYSRMSKLPSFWQEAFGAAYMDLTNEVANVRNSALTEIARMSLQSTHVLHKPPTTQSNSIR